jgi:signal transduction histidine kinase
MLDRSSAWSLRGRVLLIAAFALVASLLSGGIAMYWAASIQEDQMLDARLEHLGATILSFVEEELSETDSTGAMKYHNLKTRPAAALLYSYQVWSRDGALLMRSHEASATAPLMSLGRRGFETVRANGEEYRTFSLPTKNQEFVIQVAENVDERWVQSGLTTAYYVGFLLMPFALVSGVSWVMLRRSLSSIETIATQLSHRNPQDLTPLQVDRPPKELLPILASIDTLFTRIGGALSAERRFTSVAAHEMRTPLAGLRAQAQLAIRSRTYDESSDALKAVLRGVDRASHLLDQLLDIARLENLHEWAEWGAERVEISEVYRDVMIDFGPKAAEREIAFGVNFHVDAVYGHAFALYLLLRNLISNAILYSPVGGRVEVSLQRHLQTVVLNIDDSGPGITKADRERAFERFNRLGQSRSEGVGLGLSIVLTAVELNNAQIRLLESPLGGLRAQVVFLLPADLADPATMQHRDTG